LLTENGIDGPWLSEVMAEAGGGAAVQSFAPSLVGTGQVGENVRCMITWSDGDGGGNRDGDANEDGDVSQRPSSVVIKLASSNETSRAAAEATKTYIREVGFYRDLAPSVAIRVPAVHHVSEDRPANRFILVMEDIAPANVGNQLEGCSLTQAELAVDAAADLHGSTWGRADLTDLDWIDDPTPELAEQRAALFDMLYPAFVERYDHRLSSEAREFGAWLSGTLRRWIDARSDATRCLVHGDFRLDNLLFGTGKPAPSLTTVDWQTPNVGPGLSDVAYFLSGSLPRAELRAAEQDLLNRYRQRLAKHGVTLSSEDAASGYRLSAPGGFIMAVIASQLVGQTDRGDDMFMVMADGSACQALDLDTASLVT
jgi:aminoglycoside phosphotransferase (APT) family kinase protein